MPSSSTRQAINIAADAGETTTAQVAQENLKSIDENCKHRYQVRSCTTTKSIMHNIQCSVQPHSHNIQCSVQLTVTTFSVAYSSQ